MTRSNREAVASMGGNVLDEAMAAKVQSGASFHDVLTIGAPKASACSSCGTAIGGWDYQTLRNDADGSVARLCAKCAPPNPIADMKAVANAAHWNGLPRPTWNGLPFPEVPVKFRAEEASGQPQIERIHGAADDLRRLSACIKQAAKGGKGATSIGCVTYRVRRVARPLAVRHALDAFHIAGTSADLDSLAVALDHAANNGGAALQPVNGCWVSITRVDAPGATAPPQPTPAPGQVWAPPADRERYDGVGSNDGTLLVEHVGEGRVYFREAYGCDVALMSAANGWRCLGVETPHGRVMVGDEFANRTGDRRAVLSVGCGARVAVDLNGDGQVESYPLASMLLDPQTGMRRTRYAPARMGERYRERETDEIAIIKKGMCGLYGHRDPSGPDFTLDREPGNSPKRWLDPRKWERLDPGWEERSPHGEAWVRLLDKADAWARAGVQLSDADIDQMLANARECPVTDIRTESHVHGVFSLLRRDATGIDAMVMWCSDTPAEVRQMAARNGLSATVMRDTRDPVTGAKRGLTVVGAIVRDEPQMRPSVAGAAFRALALRDIVAGQMVTTRDVTPDPMAGNGAAARSSPRSTSVTFTTRIESLQLRDDLAALIDTLRGGEPIVLPKGARMTMESCPRTLATPGGIGASPPEPTEAERIADALLDRRCLNLGTPRREGEDDAALTARLDDAEAARLLDTAARNGAPRLAGIAYAREGRKVALPDARAFVAALDVLVRSGKVDAAVETFRRARMATGPTWLRGALERAARELPGGHEDSAERVSKPTRERGGDWFAWASSDRAHYWERRTR